jgi:hypothetical protein
MPSATGRVDRPTMTLNRFATEPQPLAGRVRFPMADAALTAALAALHADRYDLQRRQDVFDCVTLATNALERAGVHVGTLVVYLREVIRESQLHSKYYEAALIDHAIAQYHR